jgi:F-box-like
MDSLFCALQLSEHRSNRMKLEKSTIQSAWQVREHTNLASSVYSLPTEILEQIFSVARPSSPFQRKGYAVIISHVTRRWRHVALGVACLWTDIYIWLGARDACLISYLERSSNHLLDLKIDLTANSRNYWLSALRPQLAIISSQIARSRSLIVDAIHNRRLHYVMVHLSGLEVQRLEALDIRFRRASYHDGGMDILNGGAPVLSSLTMRGISGLSCTPPLAAVTRLHLGTTRPKLDLGQLYQVLTSMPSLKTLFLAADGVSFREPETSWPFIRIPTLTSLTIAYPAWHYEYNSKLYKKLVTPNLESLAIEGLTAGFPTINWDNNKQSVILDDDALVVIPPDPKYPRLRSLAVATFDMGSDVFVNLCKTLPKVNRVSFWHQQLNTTLPLLEDFEELPLLWPDLRHITVFPITYHNIDALRDVVSSRIRSGHPLHSIGHQSDLYNDIMIPDEDIEWLREHVELVVDGYQPSE